MANRVRVRLYDDQIARLARDSSGPVAAAVQRAGEIVQQGAKRRCPVSPHGSGGHPSGFLRSSIGLTVGLDDRGVVAAEVGTTAFYAAFVEFGTKPHVIRARPGGMLVFTGSDGRTVHTKEVHHPGTVAQPYLRPALDDLAGKRFKT